VGVLFLVSTLNYLDRNIISVLLEPIKQEFRVSDTLLGLLSGLSFAFFYAVAGIPIARWADRGNRRSIIAISVGIWSFMTIFCGMAQSFWQLVLARIGVGVGEAGGLPSSQSLLADYFPPDRRGKPLALLTAGNTFGYLLGVSAGGYFAAIYGWRMAFLLAGAPGLILALIVRLVLAEPRLKVQAVSVSTASETAFEAFSHLWEKRSYVYGLISLIFYFMFAYGGLIFVPSYMVRVLDIPLQQASLAYGLVAAFGSLIGTLGGGWLADKIAAWDIRWLAWIAAVSYSAAGIAFVFALLTASYWAFLGLVSLSFLLISCGIPPQLAGIHAVCGSRRRATAIAIVFFSASLIGGGLGPLIAGMLSDYFSDIYGSVGLKYGLIVVSVFLFASSYFGLRFGRWMPRDLET
jgi:predicted MFS family arabinose efflux permease